MKRDSLAVQVLLRVVPATVVVLLVTLLAAHQLLSRQLSRMIDSQLELVVRQQEQRVSDVFRGFGTDLRTLSELPAIQDHYKSVDYGLREEAQSYRENVERMFRLFKAGSRRYARIVYRDASGRVVCAVGSGGAPGLDLRRDLVDEEGRRRGTLELRPDPSFIETMLRTIPAGRRGGAYLEDGSGRILGDASLKDRTIQRRQRVEGTPWDLVVAADQREFVAPLAKAQAVAFGVGLVCLVFVLLGVLWGVGSATAPLGRLSDAIRRVAAGELDQQLPVEGSGELATLSTRFNEMARGLRRSEQALLQADRMSTMGKLIAGIAHQLNNPLQGALGTAQNLRGRAPGTGLERELETIVQCALRCKKIMENLLVFARPHFATRRPFRASDALAAVRDLMETRLRLDRVELRLELDPAERPVRGDLHRMEQAFINLVGNACDALAGTRAPRVTLRTRQDGSTLRVEISDNGPGVPSADRERIFEAFFTTKDVGRGTGLGLAIARQIVHEHGGRIWCERSSEGGAAFVLELPAIEEAAAAPAEPAASPVAPGRRILVVDDEPVISSLVEGAVRADQHEADVVHAAAEALQRLDRGVYDLIVTDLALGDVSGARIVERWRQSLRGRGCRLLVLTGDLFSPVHSELDGDPEAACLSKPFDMAEFRSAMRRLLARA